MLQEYNKHICGQMNLLEQVSQYRRNGGKKKIQQWPSYYVYILLIYGMIILWHHT